MTTDRFVVRQHNDVDLLLLLQEREGARLRMEGFATYAEACAAASRYNKTAPGAFTAKFDSSHPFRVIDLIPGSTLNDPEPPPQPNDGPAVWEAVIADMRERDQAGRTKYGTPLQAFNGRDPQRDAFQEALDLVVYLRQAIMEGRALYPVPQHAEEVARTWWALYGNHPLAAFDALPADVRTHLVNVAFGTLTRLRASLPPQPQPQPQPPQLQPQQLTVVQALRDEAFCAGQRHLRAIIANPDGESTEMDIRVGGLNQLEWRFFGRTDRAYCERAGAALEQGGWVALEWDRTVASAACVFIEPPRDRA